MGVGHEIEVEDDKAQSKNGSHSKDESSDRVNLTSKIAKNPSVRMFVFSIQCFFSIFISFELLTRLDTSLETALMDLLRVILCLYYYVSIVSSVINLSEFGQQVLLA